MMEQTGVIHSFQSMGAVDGPGLRFVVFMQGCPLRCIYCHNPDTWSFYGETYTISQVTGKIRRFKPYFQHGGGVTVSGGEALSQWEFVADLFRVLREEGIHTALDTSGIGNLKGAEQILQYTDLVICDMKFSTEEAYKKYCKGSLEQVQAFLQLTQRMEVPLWIRHVVVPGMTDTKESVQQIVELAQVYSNLEKIQLLPFHNMCISKYEALGMEFPLKDCAPCAESVIEYLQQCIPGHLK